MCSFHFATQNFTRAFELKSLTFAKKEENKTNTRAKSTGHIQILLLLLLGFLFLGLSTHTAHLLPPTLHTLSGPLPLHSLSRMGIQGQSTSTSRGQMSMAFHFVLVLPLLLSYSLLTFVLSFCWLLSAAYQSEPSLECDSIWAKSWNYSRKKSQKKLKNRTQNVRTVTKLPKY